MGYICMLLDGVYPQDIRVRKEAESLVQYGKKVMVICPSYGQMPQIENINGVLVYRIGQNYSHTKKGIYDIIESVFNINVFFYRGLSELITKYEIFHLHIHDLPLAGTGFAFRNKIKGRLILDLHENYPEALKTWFSWKKNVLIRIKNALFFNPGNWSKKEKKYCNRYDKVICVVDEMKEKLMEKFSIPEQKLTVVSNYEKKSFVDNFTDESSQNIIRRETFSIVYVGGFGPHRGLDTAIKAMPLILKEIPKAKFYLVGKGSNDVELKLKTISNENNLHGAVKFLGYRPFKEVAAIMKSADINIIPHKANEHTNNTIPHKLFQIMMSKRPLLVSSCKPLKRIVEKYDAGLVFTADSSSDFATKVIWANFNENITVSKAANAYNAVMDNLNWDSECQKLLALYNNLDD